jgi:hypothetical protein
VRGVATDVSATTGLRILCYCKDCQAFAHFLDRLDVLDSAGGTDIFQMPPGRVKLTAGADALRCLRLSEDSYVLRWYAHCCGTPIGNTAGPSFPLIGLIHAFMDHVSDGRPRDEVLGPPCCRIYDRSANGLLPADAPAPLSFRILLLRASKLLGWWVLGLARPSPFFDDRTGAPRSIPHVLTPSERARL